MNGMYEHFYERDLEDEVEALKKEVEKLRRDNAKLVLENQELRINQELSQEL